MQRLFQYLDRFYVKQSSVASLNDKGWSMILTLIGYQLFRDKVFLVTINEIVNAILKDIKKEREGEMVNQSLL
jgi:uncharacterized protein (UPF0297 family)